MKYDTVVIGSGASGLCSALALGRHGQRVALVEQAPQLAPLLRRFHRDGWWCDPALHYVGGLAPSGPLSVMFRYLGVDQLIQALPLDPDGYDVLHADPAEPIPFPVGPDRVRETLIRHYPRSRQAITAYVDKVQAVHRESPFLSFEQRPSALAEKAFAFGESLSSFLSAHGAEPALQNMLSGYGFCLCGMNGHECPMMVHAMVLGSYYFSAHALVDGGDEIVNAFERRLVEVGVDIFPDQRAAGLEVGDDRRLHGVRLDAGERLECEACVCTIHPHLLPELLPPRSIRRSFLTRIRSMDNTSGLFAVYLGVDDPPDEFRRSNSYFIGDASDRSSGGTGYAVMACGEETTGLGPKSLCLMRTYPSPSRRLQPARTSATAKAHGSYDRARPDAPSTSAATQHGYNSDGRWSRDAAYEESKQRTTENMVEVLYRQFPQLRGRCRVLDAATPSTYESYTGTVGGSAYGLKRSIYHAGLGARTPLKGLYLAGQSVLAPGLMGVLISGLLAVSNVVGHDTVWNELQKCR